MWQVEGLSGHRKQQWFERCIGKFKVKVKHVMLEENRSKALKQVVRLLGPAHGILRQQLGS